MSSVNLNRKAVDIAHEEGYITGSRSGNRDLYSLRTSYYCCYCPTYGGRGAGKDSARADLIIACAVVIFSGVIAGTCSSIAANETRLKANDYNNDALEAQKRGNYQAQRVFSIISRDKRIESVAFGLLATGCALLVAAAFGKLVVYNYPGLFDQTYLIYGSIAGASFLALGGGIYLGSSCYKEKMKKEVNRLISEIPS